MAQTIILSLLFNVMSRVPKHSEQLEAILDALYTTFVLKLDQTHFTHNFKLTVFTSLNLIRTSVDS